MSRMGNKPIAVPAAVKIAVTDGSVKVAGPKGELTQALPAGITLELEGSVLHVKCDDMENRQKNMNHGLVRSLVNSMVVGVSEGFKVNLELVGVGYRGQVKGQNLTLNLGYSIPVEYTVPEKVKISMADQTHITLESIDKQAVGQVAANIRKFRVPDAYHGKGVRYAGEQMTLKEGKKAGG